MDTVDTACHTHDSGICHAAYNTTHNASFAHACDLASVGLVVIGIVVGAWLIQRIIRRFIRNTVRGLQGERVQKGLHLIRKRTPRAFLNTGQTTTLRRAQRAETIGSILRNISTIIVAIVAVFLILHLLTVDVAPFIAGTAIATAALGFGAQNIVRDFLSGFFIVVEDQYGVGDQIETDSVKGTVETVSLRITRVRSADGTLWSIPNGEMKSVGNKSQSWARALLTFTVDVATPLDKAHEVMLHAAESVQEDTRFRHSITDHPEVWGPEEIAGKGVVFKLAVKTLPFERVRVSRALRIAVKNAFDENGIHFAEYVEAAPVPSKKHSTKSAKASKETNS